MAAWRSDRDFVGGALRRVVLLSLGFELAGFLALWWSWQASGNMPDQLLWHCAFHSVSAFCNAGFSTFSDGLMNSSTIANRPFQAVIMVLIVVGGLGFFVVGQTPRLLHAQLHKILRRRRNRTRIPVHIRLVLVCTATLLIGGWIGFWGIDLAHHGREAFNFGHAWTALFNSVTARTAGFSTMNMADLSAAALLLMVALMFIGGSPGGTAGGVKTTTMALGILELRRILLGHRDLQLGDRRIGNETLERAHATMVIAILWIVLTVIALSLVDRSHSFDDLLFEVVSAFGTVGLSRGITTDLGTGAKFILVVTMYVGRIGILTLGFTLVGPLRPQHYRLPTANLPL